MIDWRQFPFVRILIALAAGMLLQLVAGFHFPTIAVVIVAAIILLLHILARRRTLRLYRYSHWIGASIQAALVLLGNELAYNAVEIHHPNHFLNSSQPNSSVIICIAEPPLEKDNSYKAVVTIKAIASLNGMEQSCGKAIIYFDKDSLAQSLKYGDELIVKNKFQEITPPKNPDDFDYKKYLSLQNIYASAFLRDSDYHLLPSKGTNFIFQLTYWLKEQSLDAIEKYIPSQREAAVAEAMVIGDRDNLSFDTGRAFVDAGVIHIIVVAGLHVGILYIMLQRIFFFLDKRKATRIIKAALIILLIWGFAFLTGLSGPVLRAALMFSVLAIGKNLGRSTNIYNVLAGSALIILFFNPLLILQAGFQLSYLAVFGINAISPYINRWLYRTNKIVDYIWKIVAMSLSAQIVLVPFTFYYFNQFPTYFLLANIVVIPLAFAGVCMGITLIAVQWIPGVPFVIGKTMQGLIWLMNEFILSVQHLPFAVVHLSYFSFFQAVVLALALIFIIRLFISGERKLLIASLSSLLIVWMIHDFNVLQECSQKTFCVYSINRKSCFEFSENGKAFFFCSDTLDDRENFYFNHHWQLQNVSEVSTYSSAGLSSVVGGELSYQLCCYGSCFQFHNYSVAFINKPLEKNFSSRRIKMDAVILSGNKKLKMENIVSWYDAGVIIFDSSNSPYKIQRWQKDAEMFHVRTYDVSKSGAFVQHI